MGGHLIAGLASGSAGNGSKVHGHHGPGWVMFNPISTLVFSEFVAKLGSEGESAVETIVVRAVWDEEAGVWVAEGANLPDGFGLATGAATLEALEAKLPGMVQDLLGSDIIPPIEIVAKVRGRAVA